MSEFDLFSEGLLPLADAARLIPARRAGKPTSVGTLYRWCQKGVKGVKLETLQVAGSKCTSRPALSRFFARLSGNTVTTTTPQQREVAIARAEQELANI